MKTVRLESVDSTNAYARRLGCDAIVVAREQTAGMGTKGRSFSSLPGGLYLTKITHGRGYPAREVFRVMVNASLAVCKTVEAFGLEPCVRWPNDVLVQGRKIAGILIENTFSGEFLSCSAIGIGLNVNNVLPPELSDIAISVAEAKGTPVDLKRAEEALIAALGREYTLREYRSYLKFLGSRVRLLSGEAVREGVAADIDEIGRLIVEEDGKRTAYAAAEVTLRI